MEAYCEIGDMPVAWCAHCKGLKDPEEELAAQRSAEAAFIESMNDD